MKVHRTRRRDANEPDIVKALRAVGASVHRLDEEGAPDLLVGWGARTFLLEVKAPLGPRGGESHKSLTADQEKWWAKWKGAEPIIVRSMADALAAIGAIPRAV